MRVPIRTILQMHKRRLEELKKLAQGHGEEWSLNDKLTPNGQD